MYATYRHDLFYITVKYDYLPKDIQFTERTRICIKIIKMEMTQKVLKQELSFLYETHRHDMFYITVKYHQNIPNGFKLESEQETDARTDAMLIVISPEHFGGG